jgi:hypothetical protein
LFAEAKILRKFEEVISTYTCAPTRLAPLDATADPRVFYGKELKKKSRI